jgi:excisionase family DNA binding protein
MTKTITIEVQMDHNDKVQMKKSFPNSGQDADTGFFENRIETSPLKEWLNTEEAASYLTLSPGALRNLTSNGGVPYYKLGRRNRYRIDDLRALLFKNKKGEFYGL